MSTQERIEAIKILTDVFKAFVKDEYFEEAGVIQAKIMKLVELL